MAHIRQSTSDAGLSFQIKLLETFQVAAFSFGNGTDLQRPPDLGENVTKFVFLKMLKVIFKVKLTFEKRFVAPNFPSRPRSSASGSSAPPRQPLHIYMHMHIYMYTYMHIYPKSQPLV